MDSPKLLRMNFADLEARPGFAALLDRIEGNGVRSCSLPIRHARGLPTFIASDGYLQWLVGNVMGARLNILLMRIGGSVRTARLNPARHLMTSLARSRSRMAASSRPLRAMVIGSPPRVYAHVGVVA
jgi:hypothetical protein